MDNDQDRDPTQQQRPLWQWTLLAIAPGLLCVLVGALAQIKLTRDLTEALTPLGLFLPLLGLPYLIALGRAYVKAGLATSAIWFVLGFGVVNMGLWSAGCCMSISTSSFH